MFEAFEDVISFISGPRSSKELLDFLKELSQDFVAGKVTLDKTIALIAEKDSGVGAKFMALKKLSANALKVLFSLFAVSLGAFAFAADWDSGIAQLGDLKTEARQIWNQIYKAESPDIF